MDAATIFSMIEIDQLRKFNELSLNIVELIHKHGFQTESVSCLSSGFIIEFALVSGNGPYITEKFFRLLDDPKEFELRVEQLIPVEERDSSIMWKDISSKPHKRLTSQMFYPAIEKLISRCK